MTYPLAIRPLPGAVAIAVLPLLFAAALARAQGIPARVAIGLVYMARSQTFGYHMWTEVYVDKRWIPIDATLARGGIGAGHLELEHTNLQGASAYSAFLPVMKVAGRLRIEVEEVELPLKMLVLGDFTLRASAEPIAERKPINIDKDNFNEVMSSQKLDLAMQVQDKLSVEGGERLGRCRSRHSCRGARLAHLHTVLRQTGAAGAAAAVPVFHVVVLDVHRRVSRRDRSRIPGAA